MMNSIILKARNELDLLAKNVPQGKHIVTTDIRKLSGKLYRSLDNHNREVVFALCEELLEQRNWESGVIAFDWAYRVRAQYNENTYSVFYDWLKKYVRGWGDCDDFCTHAFGALIRNYKYLFRKFSNGPGMMIFGFAVRLRSFLYLLSFITIMKVFAPIRFLVPFCLISMIWFKKDMAGC